MTADRLFNLSCIKCGKGVVKSEDGLYCPICHKTYRIIGGIPVFFSPSAETGKDIRLAQEKWGEYYRNFEWEREREVYDKKNTPHILRHLPELNAGQSFLEIGGGASFLCFGLAKHGPHVASIDFDINILKIAKQHFQKHNVAGFFACAQMHHLPFLNETFDASAGIGVIEHSRDLSGVVKEIYRVTKKGGYTFQTVPAISLTTLILNQRHGTIPHLPTAREIFTFIHTKLLGARHMKCGYEESFTQSFLKHTFERAGFWNVETGFYDYGQTIAKKAFGNVLKPLIKLRPFWDIVYIKAYK